MSEMAERVHINVGAVTGEPFNTWYVFIRWGDTESRAGPFGRQDAEQVCRHYELLMELARKSVLAEMRAALGVNEGP